MHDFAYYLHAIVDFFSNGMHEGFSRVNAVLGLIIALIAAYSMSEWKRIWAITLAATVAHLIAEWVIPILDNRAPFRLPPEMLQLSYWRTAVALYIGYFIVISIFFFLKTQILPKGGAAHAKH